MSEPPVHADSPFTFVTSGSRGWAQYYSDRGAPFIRIGDLSRGTLRVDWQNAQRVQPPGNAEGRRTRAHPGDVLISITADLGVIGVVPEGVPEVFINQHIALARPRAGLDSRYLGWFLDSDAGGQRQLRIARRGATKAGLGLDDIRGLRVPAPELPIQRRVVAAIDQHFSRLDAAVASLTRAKANVANARASVLKAAVEGQLGRVGANATCDDAWPTATVHELAQDLCDGPFGSNLKTEHYTEDGPRVVRLQNIGNGTFRDERAHIAPSHFERLRKHEVQAGDVIVASLGEVLPRACIAPAWLGPAIVKADCIRMRVNPTVLPGWLNIALNSPPVRRATTKRIHGVGRPRLGLSGIREISVPLPSLAEQRALVSEVERRLSVLEATERGVDGLLAQTVTLRQAILKQAFEGRLVGVTTGSESRVSRPASTARTPT